MTGLLHHLGARIVVLVDAVAEAHKPDAFALVLDAPDKLGDRIDRSDFLKHLQRSLVGTAVGRSPKAGDAGRDACERIGAG